MSWAIVIAAGATVVGGAVSAQGAKKAGDKAAQGSEASIAEQRRQFDMIRSDTAPYRAIGTQALNALGSIYGYSPAPAAPNAFAGSPTFQGSVSVPKPADQFLKRAMSPETAIRGALDPLGSSIKSFKSFGGLFGSKKGDEKRNLNAFMAENQVYDLGDGNLGLADGTVFPQSKLEEIAGHWYGATYAPDGNQEQWQQSFNNLITPYRPAQGANVGQAGGGLTSDGVQQGFPSPTSPSTGNPMAGPDYSAFFKSPDYEFRRTEGQRDVGNSFAARGGAFSGNALRALTEFNSNLAAGEFGNYFNRQAALAGIGQTATNTSANAGLTTGANVGNALINAGNARASGVADQYNAIGAGLSGLGQAAGYWSANRGKSPNSYGNQMWRYGPPGSYA